MAVLYLTYEQGNHPLHIPGKVKFMNEVQQRVVNRIRADIESQLKARNERNTTHEGVYTLKEFKAEPLGDVKNHITLVAKTTLMNLGAYNEICSEKHIHIFIGVKGGIKGSAYRFNAGRRAIRDYPTALIALYQ